VLVPSLPYITDAAERAFAAATGIVLYGPRTGSRTRHHAIPSGLAPGPLRALVPMKISEVSSLRPGLSDSVSGSVEGKAIRWREHLTASATVEARFANGDPALVSNGNHHYLACWPDPALLRGVMRLLAGRASLAVTDLPEHIRTRRRGDLSFVFNYGDTAWSCPDGGGALLGSSPLGPQSVLIRR
jgi:beta-galactosidase